MPPPTLRAVASLGEAPRSLIDPAPSAAPRRLRRRDVAAATAAPANTAPHEIRLRLPKKENPPNLDEPSPTLAMDMRYSPFSNQDERLKSLIEDSQLWCFHEAVFDASVSEPAFRCLVAGDRVGASEAFRN
jgi:hypothetical protein